MAFFPRLDFDGTTTDWTRAPRRDSDLPLLMNLTGKICLKKNLLQLELSFVRIKYLSVHEAAEKLKQNSLFEPKVFRQLVRRSTRPFGQLDIPHAQWTSGARDWLGDGTTLKMMSHEHSSQF